MELNYSKTYNNLWRCVLKEDGTSLVPHIEPKDLETIEAREVFYCEVPFDISHDKIVRIFSNNKYQLAVLIPYDVYMLASGFYGTWYSNRAFDYDFVEIYVETINVSCRRVVLVNHEQNGNWVVTEIICPDFTFMRPITVMRTLGCGKLKNETLLNTGLNMKTFEKIYPVYNALDSNQWRRYTQDKVTALNDREIFVFGSNPAGIHNGAAAKFAKDKFGAIQGQGEGIQGQSYAIPTTQGGLKELKKHIYTFIDFAINNPQYTFLVTKIGCGNAGFKVKDVAPLFRFAIGQDNIVLPKEFVDELGV